VVIDRCNCTYGSDTSLAVCNARCSYQHLFGYVASVSVDVERWRFIASGPIIVVHVGHSATWAKNAMCAPLLQAMHMSSIKFNHSKQYMCV
jgi:hypothetical protein